MKTSARRAVLAVALAAALYLVLVGDRPETSDAVVETASTRSTPAGGRDGARKAAEAIEILELVPRSKAGAAVTALFGRTTWAAPPKTEAPPPAPTPQAPPLPFTYVGKRLEGDRWEVFVGRGNDTLILKDGDTVDSAYRVESIKPPSMVVVYLPLNEKQTLNIGATE